jgi:thioredoxin-related protein
MKICFILVSFFWAIPQGLAQLHLAQLEQIESLQTVEKRNVIVFIHTDWCKYCKVMHDKTFKNETVIKLINDKFYFIDFDAEVNHSSTCKILFRNLMKFPVVVKKLTLFRINKNNISLAK